MAEDVEKTLNMDKKMDELFDWASDDKTPVRDALWDHFMDNDDKNTVKTIAKMKEFEDMDDDKVPAAAEKLLKK